ncbi:MAG: methylated-DNA--[protein]-cysteine S-methyltransferase [Bacillota bacterium]
MVAECEFSCFSTGLGWITLAWSHNGLRRVLLPVPNFQEAEVRVLAEGWAKCQSLPKWVEQLEGELVGYLEGRRVDLSWVKVDNSRATQFQRNVYQALRKVPYGSTVSYSELASLAGYPGAARAVGQACATNPVPLVVPCHRVIRGNGSIGGFAGGTPMKRKLLQIEGVLVL